MVSAADVPRLALAASFSRQEDDGQPILLSAMWLVPGALVGAAVVMILFIAQKKR